MRWLWILLVLPSFLLAKTEEWREIIKSLLPEEREVLESFFHSLFTDLSFGGYVLYGNKPVFIEGFLPEETIVKCVDERIARTSTHFKEGVVLWKKLGLGKYCKNFFIIAYEKPCYDWLHVLLINKREFTNVVNQNLSLFQYILGPKVTAENLFSQLMNEKDNFESIIKYNTVLEGVVFGFGTQNAIEYSRSEKLKKDMKRMRNFPFKSNRNIQDLQEELNWLEKKATLSNSSNKNKFLLLPWFACYDSEESAKIIRGYKRAQKKILHVLKSEHFLEEVLTKFFEEP